MAKDDEFYLLSSGTASIGENKQVYEIDPRGKDTGGIECKLYYKGSLYPPDGF